MTAFSSEVYVPTSVRQGLVPVLPLWGGIGLAATALAVAAGIEVAQGWVIMLGLAFPAVIALCLQLARTFSAGKVPESHENILNSLSNRIASVDTQIRPLIDT